jgi:superfamily I DNA/RNA helicase
MPQLVEKLKSYIDSDAITPEQRAVCYRDGSFVVRACPGSGKTRTTATRFAWRTANWRSRHSGVAVLSFTNVAWKEIGQQLQVLGLSPSPPWPHFLGTIDAFVNRHIFLPFGHLVMGCKCRPEIVHEGNELWVDNHLNLGRFKDCRKHGCSPLSFLLKLDGSVQFRPRGFMRQPTKCGQEHCGELKQAMARKGLALYGDAMYWGLQVLRDASIRRAIASRFPEVIIDEAQDTSEVQFRIIENLVEAGVRVVLVGDPDQAIYEFHDARPDLFESFEKRWPTLPLSSNFRSSQLICNVTWRFSSLTAASTAAGPTRDHAVMPFLLLYTPEQEATLLPWFRDRLAEQSIQVSNAVVLARRHKTVAKLRGIIAKEWPSRVSPLSKALGRAVVYRELGLYAEAHETLMWALLRLCFDRSSYGPHREAIASVGDRDWRRHSWRLLQELPPSSTALSAWGPSLGVVLQPFLLATGWPCTVHLGKTFCRCNHQAGNNPVAAFVQLPPSNPGLTCKVIHQAKGESYDAVMVVCSPAQGRRLGDFEQWLFPPTGEGAAERRTGYVGLTRARSLLVLAVPEGTRLDDERTAILAEGFDIQK